MKKLVLLSLSLILILSLFSCSGYRIKYIYPDGDNYTFGNTTVSDKIKNIEVDWLDGSVNIKYSNKNVIDVYEPDEEKYASEQCLHWWVDGDTLRIQFSASLMIEPFIHRKDLILTLPEDLSLSKLRINTTSADIIGNYLKADDIEMTATSGDIDIICEQVNRTRIESTSGKIKASHTGSCDEFIIESTSGDSELSFEKIGKLDVATTSGDVLASFKKAPEKLEIDTTSGNVTVKVPKDSGFTSVFDTLSGKFECNIPAKKNGHKYTAGDGSAQFEINTTSGNAKIN